MGEIFIYGYRSLVTSVDYSVMAISTATQNIRESVSLPRIPSVGTHIGLGGTVAGDGTVYMPIRGGFGDPAWVYLPRNLQSYTLGPSVPDFRFCEYVVATGTTLVACGYAPSLESRFVWVKNPRDNGIPYQTLTSPQEFDDDEGDAESPAADRFGNIYYTTEGPFVHRVSPEMDEDIAMNLLEDPIFAEYSFGQYDIDLEAPAWDRKSGLLYAWGKLHGAPNSSHPSGLPGYIYDTWLFECDPTTTLWRLVGNLASPSGNGFSSTGVVQDGHYYFCPDSDRIYRMSVDTYDIELWMTFPDVQILSNIGVSVIPPMRMRQRDDAVIPTGGRVASGRLASSMSRQASERQGLRNTYF